MAPHNPVRQLSLKDLWRRLWTPLTRWWRSRGHGVHSPFAFRFIRGVLRESLPYYNYVRLDALGGDVRWHRLLFRLVCEAEPLAVVATHLSQAEKCAIALADSRVKLLAAADVSPRFPAGTIELPGRELTIVIVRDVRAEYTPWLHLTMSLSHGMTFSNGTVGIAVLRHDLPRQDFTINF